MHVIVGAGSIGSTIATELAGAGEQVRVITRSGSGPAHDRIERVAANASDAATLRGLAAGATVIYNCANPPYHEWPKQWPPLAESLLGAAEATGAPLVITGNLYVYGPVDRPMTEDMPLLAPTVKGKVRVKLWQDAVRAYRDGRIKGVTEVRASDFLGPKHSMLEMAVPAMRAGKAVWLPMPLDTPHTYTYTGDVAAAMIRLARDERAWGQAWHVPSAAPMTARELLGHAARLGGLAKPKLRRLPDIAMRAAGLVNPFAREFTEMSYQFKRPFVLDTSRTEQVFGLRATELDEALLVTLRNI
jgi:nucleoside-diphosphate-sugar epimerase